MELSGVYVFGRDDVDIDTTGLVGDLQPISCVFTEKKNGDSSLEMRLCYDGLNKWAAVKPGCYIKAKVPVRVPPRIVSSAYTTEVTTYRVKTTITRTATVYQSTGKVIHQAGVGNQGRPRPEPLAISRVSYALDIDGKLEMIQKPVQVKYRLNPGAEVQLLAEDGEKAKIYAPSFGTGWTLMSNLEAVKTTQILGTFNGVEAVTDAVRLQYQLFQVTGVEQSLDGIDVTAHHVFYELLTNYTTYKTDREAYCADAINGVFGGMTTPDERFTCLTDCKDKAGPMDYDRVNVVQALLDPEDGICARYGLSLVRNNYDLYALKNVGSDRGFVVEYGKNMLDVNRTEKISNVITRIIPYGKTKKGDIVYMDGTAYVDSPHIGDYATPRTMYLDCSDTAKESKDMTLAQVKEELKRRAQAEFDAGCDLPELSMTVDFLSLGDTEEYKQYRDLDKVFLLDKITVRDRVRGYDYNAEVVAITHNVLTGMLESVTLGSIDKGSGIRKIPTWQVPEVDGSNIRLASIAAGALAGGAVNDDNLQDDSVTTRAIRAQSVTTEKLAAGSITADKIEAGSVTTEKLAAGAVTADTVAAGAISTEKLQAGAVNADKLAANAVTAGKIAAGAVVASKIDASAVTADKIAAGAVSAGKIAAGAVTTDKLAAGAVNADKLAANSVTAGKIAAGAVTAGNIAAHAVTTEKIATGAITAESGIIAESAIGTSQIADASITDAKIVGLTANKLTAGTIDASEIAVVNLVADNITTGTINGQVIPVLGGDKLAAGAVTGEKIAKNAVTADKIVAGAVTTDKLAANAVTANKILAGAVTADKLSASAVTADKIAAGAITTNKLSSDVGANLDLSSNKSINLMVSGIETDIGDIEERVTDAETAISQNAGAIALRATKSEVSTAKSEAISAAATDATTKANNAKSAAISAAATDATTKSNNALAAAKTYADAQIQISADAIKSTVEAEYTKKIYHSADGTAGTAGYVAFAELTVTGSYANRPVLFGLVNRGRLESSVSVRFDNINSADPTLAGIYETGGINTWIEKTATSKWRVIAQKSEGWDTIYVNDFTNNNSNIAVAWINVHLNAVPSGATASTKLVGSQAISTIATKSEVTQTANSIRSEVSAKLGNYSTTAQMNSAIDQKAGQITSSVSATYATKTDLNTTNSNVSSLSTRVTQTESQWSVTSAKVDGMYTGGQNLLKKHNFATGKWCGENPRGTWTDFPDWQQPLFSSSYGFVRNATSGNSIPLGSITGVSLTNWGDYTLSFSAYCDSPSGEWTETQDIYARVFRTTEYSDRLEKKVTLSTGVRRFQFTFNTGATGINGGIDFLSWESGSTQSLKYKVSIGDIMLVKGTTPAAWSPNEWDGAKTTTVTVDHTGMYVNTEGVVEFNTNKFSVSPPDGNDQLFSVSASDRTVRAQGGYFDGYLYAPNMATRTTSAYKYINVGGSGDYPTIQAAWDSLPEVCGEVHFMVNADAPGTAYLRGKYVSFLAIYGNGGTYNIGNVYAWGMHGRFTDVIMSNNGNSGSNACQLYASVLNFERVKFASSGRALQAFNSCRISMNGCSMTGIGSYTYMQNACIDLYGSNININNVTGRGQITGLYLADGSLAVIKGTCCGPTINAAGGHVIGDYSLDGTTVEKPTVSTSSAFSASTCVTWQSTYGSTWKKITSSVGAKVESRHSTTSSGFDYRAGWWVLDTGTAIKTALSGKTISKATVTIRRNDTNSDARVCHLCYHSMVDTKMNGYDGSASGIGSITGYGIMTQIGTYTLAASTETVITLPSSVYAKLKDGTIRGFGLVDNSTDYRQIMCDNSCTLTVTYT